MKGTRLSITVTGWGLHYSKTFSPVFITTDKLCEGLGLATVSQLSQQPQSLIRNWATERSGFARVSRDLGGIHLTREIYRARICIWTCSHTFYCIWSPVSLTVLSIPSQCMTHLRPEKMFVSSHCPPQVPRMSRQEGNTFLHRSFTDSIAQGVEKQSLHTVPARSGRQWQRWRQSQGSWTPGRCSSARWRGHRPAQCGSAACNGAWSAGWSGTHTKDKVPMCHHCQHTADSLGRLPGQPGLTRDLSPPNHCSDSTDPRLP